MRYFHWEDAGIGDGDVGFAVVLDDWIGHCLDIADTPGIGVDSKGTVTVDRFDELVGRGLVGRVVDQILKLHLGQDGLQWLCRCLDCDQQSFLFQRRGCLLQDERHALEDTCDKGNFARRCTERHDLK